MKKNNNNLRTNSKQARENVIDYILRNFDAGDYDELTPPDASNFKQVARYILDVFYIEKVKYDCRGLDIQSLFVEWCSGLPSVLDCCYYYNRSAVADLGDILQQDDATRNRYTESDAERMLTWLIYREVSKAAGLIVNYNFYGKCYYMHFV